MSSASFRRGASIFPLAFLSACFSFSGSAATLSGTLALPNNRPLGATLTLHDLSTPRTQGSHPYDHQFASKPDGTFSLTAIPAGKYRICIDAPADNVLDPCLWSNTQPTFTLADNTTLSAIALKAEVGTRLTVHVNDPEAALPESKGGARGSNASGPALSMVVMSSRKRYHPLREAFSGPTGSDHFAIVPFNEAVTLITESASLALKDKDGNRISGDSQKTLLRVAPGKLPDPATISVGKR